MSGMRSGERSSKSETTAPKMKNPDRRARGSGHDKPKDFAGSSGCMGLTKLAIVAGRVNAVTNQRLAPKISSETPKNEPQSMCDAWDVWSDVEGSPSRAKLMYRQYVDKMTAKPETIAIILRAQFCNARSETPFKIPRTPRIISE